jgi:diguanylate cyclase (GGDEF)-like protein
MSTLIRVIEPELRRERVFATTKIFAIFLGVICVSFALITFPPGSLTAGFFVIVGMSVLIAPRMSLELPRSKFAITFSDALIFLTFLFYGGQAAILVAVIESVANCFYLRSRGFKFGQYMIPANGSVTAIATAATFIAWSAIQQSSLLDLDLSKTQHLITAVGLLAASQFLVSSALAAMLQAVKVSGNAWTIWKNDCFASSMAQIVGAGLAALIYKLINYGDLMTAGLAFVALAVAFLNYRRSISEINEAIGQVEAAEREKAETERDRRREAEKHAEQLAGSLQKEERANAALRKSEKDFQHAALHDSLTGLANRKQLNDILISLIAAYKHNPATTFQVLFLDIRSFKNINDMLGHTIGDKVLAIAAKRFQRLVNHSDVVARIGGDEFAIVLRNVSTPGKAHKVARRIYDSIKQPFSLGGHKIAIDMNIGIASCDADYTSPEEILRDADIAMHFAKERNDGLAVFTPDLRSRFQERVRFEMDLRHAIDRHEMSMHYQPIISLEEGQLIGFEALLRWHHSEFGPISPNKFIPIAEQSGMIQPITVWILHETCRQLAAWQQIGPEYKDLVVSVNISGKHLSNNDLIDDVENALAASKLNPHSLKLEITESSAMENAEHTISVLNRLKQTGVQLSIDDFGTGYSSLSYLQRLPFDTLKIDRTFVYSVGEDGENSEILRTIISLAKSLRLRVIAEGIETETQLSVLKRLGCDYGQGYLLAKPKGKDETERLLYSRPNWLPAASIDHFEPTTADGDDAHLPVF